MKVNKKKFILFHKKRVSLLKRLSDEGNWGRLIYQIFFLGVESLAKIMYPKNDIGERFILFLSKRIGKKDAEEMWYFWRNPLTHRGFLEHWTPLETWGEDDIDFIIYPMDEIFGGWQFDPKTVHHIYDGLIDDFENHFKDSEIIEV